MFRSDPEFLMPARIKNLSPAFNFFIENLNHWMEFWLFFLVSLAQVLWASFPVYPVDIIGDKLKTIEFLKNNQSYLNPKDVKILISPFFDSRGFIPGDIAPLIAGLCIDELASSEQFVAGLASALLTAFDPETSHAIEGLVISFQVDWLLHNSLKRKYSDNVIEALIMRRQVLATFMRKNPQYWRNLFDLARVPYSLILFKGT